VAVAEPFLLTAGDTGIVGFALVVLALQCLAGAGALALALRRGPGAASAVAAA
jgi:hypothetical protein